MPLIITNRAAACVTARPLNHLAKTTNANSMHDSPGILLLATQVLRYANEDLVAALNQPFSLSKMLPLSRVTNLATASLAPMLGALCVNPHTRGSVVDTVVVAVQASAISISRIPELVCESVLSHEQYDIRGAMRGPGGEDHVGCLTLMRLVFESDCLARVILQSSPQLVPRLCDLYRELKAIEIERGQGVMHGRGVTPKSRRILLNIICHIEILSDGQAGASSMLGDLFRSIVAGIASFKPISQFDERTYYQICESTFDITSFSPRIVRSLFQAQDPCLEVLVSACNEGYSRLSITSPPDSLSFQVCTLRSHGL